MLASRTLYLPGCNERPLMSKLQPTISEDQVPGLITAILGKLSSHAEISEQSHLIRDLAMDSMDVMDALQDVEDELDLVIPTDILPRLQTVGDLVQEVQRRLPKGR